VQWTSDDYCEVGPIIRYWNDSYFKSIGVWQTSVLVQNLTSCPFVTVPYKRKLPTVQASWNVMAHAQKPDFIFRRNGRVHLKRRGRQFSRLLAADVWASAVVMLDAPCSEVVWRVLATHSICQVPLHFPSRVSPCAITFQLQSNRKPITKRIRNTLLQTVSFYKIVRDLYISRPFVRRFYCLCWRCNVCRIHVDV